MHHKESATLRRNRTPQSPSLSLPLHLSLRHSLMSDPLDVDSELIWVLNEWCFINGAIIRLPAGGQAPSIFLYGGLTMKEE